LRSACGSIFTSDYTSKETFSTASSEPTVEITSTLIRWDCAHELVATSGFLNYQWSNGTTTIDAGDTTAMTVFAPGTYTVTATDVNGCQAIDDIVIGSYPSGCVGDIKDVALQDLVLAQQIQIKADIKLVAKGLAGVKDHTTVKSLVKKLALQAEEPREFRLSMSVLRDSCTGRGYNLLNEIKTALWNSDSSASDTARIAVILERITLQQSPAEYLYFEIFAPYYGSDNQDPYYPSWDSISAPSIAASGFHSSPYTLYYKSGNDLMYNSTNVENWVDTPVWQVGLISNYLDAWKTDTTVMPGPKAICRCYDSGYNYPSGRNLYGCDPRGDKNRCGKDMGGCSNPCNNLISRLVRVFCCD
jgi:hypothetical protein